ncbi:MAG TPA: UDP-2,3-diacylglucosamine diphosphatase [Rubrivivax sp.]|nr:UDP-2,3-diacylglucosamine diphosphatase [Rubrivivax sp.]
MQCPLPRAAEWVVPQTWRAVDFISDLHLSAALPHTFEAWSVYLKATRADAVVILGDLFEFWPGSDAVQLDFEARCMQVLRDAAAQRHVALMVGNRDFLLEPSLLQRLGVHWLADPTLLRAWQRHALWLTHGDALCLDDVAYQRFRTLVRDPQTQAAFLARPLAERVRLGAEARHASEAGRRRTAPPGGWPDLDLAACVECLRRDGAHTMIHGHTHRPGASALAPGFARQVLSDWDLDEPSPRAEVLRLSRDGLARMAPAAACAGA